MQYNNYVFITGNAVSLGWYFIKFIFHFFNFYLMKHANLMLIAKVFKNQSLLLRDDAKKIETKNIVLFACKTDHLLVL